MCQSTCSASPVHYYRNAFYKSNQIIASTCDFFLKTNISRLPLSILFSCNGKRINLMCQLFIFIFHFHVFQSYNGWNSISSVSVSIYSVPLIPLAKCKSQPRIIAWPKWNWMDEQQRQQQKMELENKRNGQHLARLFCHKFTIRLKPMGRRARYIRQQYFESIVKLSKYCVQPAFGVAWSNLSMYWVSGKVTTTTKKKKTM